MLVNSIQLSAITTCLNIIATTNNHLKKINKLLGLQIFILHPLKLMNFMTKLHWLYEGLPCDIADVAIH